MCADEHDGEMGEMAAEIGWTLVWMEEERMSKRVERLREQHRRRRG